MAIMMLWSWGENFRCHKYSITKTRYDWKCWKIITFAPRKGKKPLGVFIDKDSDLLSFPTIYRGKAQADNKDRSTPVHYSTICKSELRSQ